MRRAKCQDRNEAGTTRLETSTTTSRIWEEGLRLAPWHLQVEITPDLTTRDLFERSDKQVGGFTDPIPELTSIYSRLYPDGFKGRRVLDCACNNGAFLFAAKEAGAGACLGFDVREQWIEQARFLVRHRQGPSDDMHFETCDLYDLPERGIEPCDFTIFAGILYHVPDPIRALQIVGDLTREVMYINTAALAGWRDGAFVAEQEPEEHPLCGVYGLNWFPTGPRALIKTLRWLGFEEVRVWDWFARPPRPQGQPERDRIKLLAFRDRSVLESWDAGGPKDELGRLRERVVATVPPRATVLVATNGEEHYLEAIPRPAEHFPQNGIGVFHPNLGDGRPLMARLDELRARGARHLVIPASSLGWLESVPEFRRYLELRYSAVASDPDRDGCIIFELTA